MTVTPAYNRDYKTSKEVKLAWAAGNDFVIADMFGGDCGRYINKQDADTGNVRGIMVRYARLTKVVPVS